MSFTLRFGTLKSVAAAVALTCAGHAYAADYLAEPADGASVATLSTVEVTFAGVESVTEVGYATTLSRGEQNFRVATSTEANRYVVTVREQLSPGAYTLTIPGGTVALDGVTLTEAISLNYNVSGTGYAGLLVEPAPGRVGALSEFVLTLDGATHASYVASSTETAVYLTRNGERMQTFTQAVTRANTLTFQLYNTLTEAGNYQLVIPANSVTADGTAIEPVTLDYSIVVPVVTVTPEAGSVYALDVVTFTFDGVTELIEANYSGVTFTGADGSSVRYLTAVSGNEFSVRPLDALAPGEYTVKVAPGTLTCDGFSYNEELTAAYTLEAVAPEYTVVANPADGAELLTLGKVSLTFEGIEAVGSIVESTEQAPYITCNGDRVTTITMIACDANVMTLSLFEAITAPGQYTVVVPGTGYAVDGAYGRDITLNYTVKGLAYTVTPAEDTVAELSEITFTFEGVTQVSEVGYNVYLTDANGAAHRVRTAVSGNTYKVVVIDPVKTAGVYDLFVPAGTLALDGVTLESALETSFTVAPVAAAFTVVADPADGSEVQVIKSIAITLEGVDNVAVCELSSETAPYIANEEGARMATFTNVTASGNVLTIALYGEFNVAGNAKVVVPASCYTANGLPGSEIVLNYTVKESNGIEAVIAEADSTPATVYNAQGQMISAAADGAALRALPRGLYIINGKKVAK